MASGDDVHHCLRCDNEIKGLMEYVEHRQSQCSSAENPEAEVNGDKGGDEQQEKVDENHTVIEAMVVDPESDEETGSASMKRSRKRKAPSPQHSPQRTPERPKVEERTADSPRRSGRRGIRISYADLAAGRDRSEARMSSDDGKAKVVKPKESKGKHSKGKESKAKDVKPKDSKPKVITAKGETKDTIPRKVGRPPKKAIEKGTSEEEKQLKSETVGEETVEEKATEKKAIEKKAIEKKTAPKKTLGQIVKLRALQTENKKSLKNRRKLKAAAQKKLAAKSTKTKTKTTKEQKEEGGEEENDAASNEGDDGWRDDDTPVENEGEVQNQEAAILIKDGKFYCTVCRIFCSSKKKIDVHCSTRKHAKRLKLGAIYVEEEESSTEREVSHEILECSICSYRTKNEGHFARHLASISHAQKAEVELFACDKCHRKYKTEEELQNHQEFHAVPRCGMCKETFETEELLEKHIEERGHKIENRCPECNKTFSSKGNLRNHMRIHDPNCKYSCDLCDYTCVQWADMKKHKYRHMGFKPYKCGLCEAQSLTKHGMERHMRTHLVRSKDYKCDICGKGYYEEYLMKQHKYMKHNLERRFPCDFEGCTFAFKFKSSLLTHQRMHTQEKPYLCSDCGYKASTKYALTKHIRLHTGEKPFHCDFPNCNYRCRLSTHLTRHKIIHTGLKPYRCPFCSYACNNKQNLRKHLLNTKSHSGLKMYKCESCPDYSTNVFRDYVIHIRKNHADDDKYISYFEVAESVTRKNENMALALKNEENVAAEVIETEEMMAEEDLKSFSVVTIVPGKKRGKKRNVTIMDDREEVQKKLEQVILALEDHSAEVEAKAAEESAALGNISQETAETEVPVHANSLGDLVSLAAKELALGKEGETIVIVPEVEHETEVCTTEATETVVSTGEGGEGITQFVVEFDEQGRLVTEEDLAAATWLHNMSNIQDVTVEIQEEPAAEEVHQ